MGGTKRNSLSARKQVKTKKKRLARSIASYLKTDIYLFAPLFSDSPSLATPIQTHSPLNYVSSEADDDVSDEGLEALEIKKKERRISEKVKEYLNSDCYMYAPIISPEKLDSSPKGKLQITNLVTVEVSTSSTTMKENNNLRDLQSDKGEHTLHNGTIHSRKRAPDIVEGLRTRRNPEADLSPAFSSLPEEKMATPDQRRVTVE